MYNNISVFWFAAAGNTFYNKNLDYLMSVLELYLNVNVKSF